MGNIKNVFVYIGDLFITIILYTIFVFGLICIVPLSILFMIVFVIWFLIELFIWYIGDKFNKNSI